MNRVTTYDQLRDLKNELYKTADDGTLTPEQLGDAVDTIDEAGYECIPSSVGMDWIGDNIASFARLIPDSLSFWRAHMHNPYIEIAVRQEALLKLIPADKREEFVIEVFEQHGTERSFIAALDSGVSRQALANALLNKLRNTEVATNSSRTDFVTYEFMRYGGGIVDGYRNGDHVICSTHDKNTLWSMLDDTEFWQAMLICADKAPNRFFKGRDIAGENYTMFERLSLRLSHEERMKLFIRAAGNLRTLDGVSLSELGRLYGNTWLHRSLRLDIAQRTGGRIDFIVELALDYGTHFGGFAILHQFDYLFKETANATYYFRTLWNKLDAATETAVANRIKQLLTEQVQAAGYILGQVTTGTYYNRNYRRHVEQMQVIADKITYVQDRKQHRYSAKEGDWVLIDTKWVTSLTPRVKAAVFIPAHHGGEYN